MSTPSLCPLCGSINSIKTYLNLKDVLVLYCCYCQNAFCFPPPKNTNQLHDILGNTHTAEISELPVQWQHSLNLQIQMIISHLKPGSTILEIGCGRGILLDMLNKCGYKVTGIEPEINAFEYCQKKGLTVINTYFPSPEVANKHFDLVIVSHVAEHIVDLNDFFKSLKHHCQSGMILFVQTNFKGLLPKLYRSSWYAWEPKYHFWHFSPKGLTFLLERHQISTKVIKYCSLVHSDQFLTGFYRIIPWFGDQFILLASVS